MPLFQLDPRLSLCANMVRKNSRLADIGTDHAYLPVWLACKNWILSAIAADINVGPLQRAKENIEKYQMHGKVEARLSNGLEKIDSTEVDDIVIAGMGGELIAKILGACSWIKDKEKNLILQPMTSSEELRIFLFQQGFCIRKETAVVSEKHIYSVMQVNYAPGEQTMDQVYPYIGMVRGCNKAEQLYLKRVRDSLQKRANGLLCMERKKEAEILFSVIQKIENIEMGD